MNQLQVKLTIHLSLTQWTNKFVWVVYEYMPVAVWEAWMEEASRHCQISGQQIKLVVRWTILILVIKLWSFERAASILNFETFSLPPETRSFYSVSLQSLYHEVMLEFVKSLAYTLPVYIEMIMWILLLIEFMWFVHDEPSLDFCQDATLITVDSLFEGLLNSYFVVGFNLIDNFFIYVNHRVLFYNFFVVVSSSGFGVRIIFALEN